MANNLAEVEIVTTEHQLAEEATEKLIGLVEELLGEGYEPSESNLEVILIQVLSLLAANVANIAAVVPPAVLRKYGTELIKVEFHNGAAALGTTKWTVIPNAETIRQIPGGFTIEAGGLAFQVEKDTEVPISASSVSVQVVAVEAGEEYNGVEGVAEQVNPLDWVTEVAFTGITTGGANQETDDEYLARLVKALELQAPRPITAEDYSSFVLDAPTDLIPSGLRVGRATTVDGYNAETAEENVERCVTTFVTDVDGEELSSEAMEALQAWVREFREINFLAFIRPPESYHEIYITFKIHPQEGYSGEALVAQVKEKLLEKVSPAHWSQQITGGTNAWINEKPSKVRYNYLIGLIESVPGVAFVYPGAEGLKIGLSATPTGTTDLTLTGQAPLPTTKTAHILGSAE